MKLLPLTIASCFLVMPVLAKQKALLVGINNYKDPRDRLKGCLNDVQLVKQTLIKKLGFKEQDILVITDAQATTSNIVTKFKSHLINGVNKDDSVVFFFSGHGTLAPDLNGDEVDGKDELICTYDLDPRVKSTWFTDDLMNSLIRRLPTQKAWVIFDCCHSGTGNRGLKTKPLPADTVGRYMHIGFSEADSTAVQRNLVSRGVTKKLAESEVAERSQSMITRSVKTSHVFFSACQSYQLALETNFAGRRHGILTKNLCSLIEKRPEITFGELSSEVRKRVEAASQRRNRLQRPYFTALNPQLSLSNYLNGSANELVPHMPPVSAPLKFWGYRPKGDIKVDMKLSQNVLKKGEKLRFSVTADADCYLRVYHYGVDNSVVQIFPNKFQKDNKLKAGVPMLIPPKGGAFQFTMGEPFGNEVLKAVVSKKQFSDIEVAEFATTMFKQYQDLNVADSSKRGVRAGGVSSLLGYGENITVYTIKP